MRKPKGYHHGDLKRALIEEGRAMIIESGLEQLSLRALARRAGVTHAAPYRHFADKDALVAAIAALGFEKLVDGLSATLSGAAPIAPDERLLRMGVAYVHFAVEHPAEFRTMWSPQLIESGRFPELLVHADRARDLFANALLDARGEHFVDVEKSPAAVCSWALVHGLSVLFLDGLLARVPLHAVPAFTRSVLRQAHVGIMSSHEVRFDA